MNVKIDFIKIELSPLEEKLLGHFIPTLGWLKNTFSQNVHMLYIKATHEAFTYPEKYEQNYIDALHAVNVARDKDTFIRLTPEFEKIVAGYGIV